MNKRLLWLFIVLAVADWGFADVVLDDGLIHNIDYVVDQDFYVNDSVSGSSTQVNAVDGAVFSTIAVFGGHSRLNASGAQFPCNNFTDYLEMNDHSIALITGGYVGRCTFAENSTTTIYGNAELGVCYVSGNSTVSIEGDAVVGALQTMESPSVTISGGYYTYVDILGSSRLDISGGLFQGDVDLISYAAAISGGIFEDNISFGGDFLISGGLFGGDLTLGHSASVIFAGNNFAIDGIEIEPGTPVEELGLSTIMMNGEKPFLTGVLTGMLADGTQINQSIYLEDLSEYGEAIPELYFIPEPASLWLILTGGAWLVRRKRQ